MPHYYSRRFCVAPAAQIVWGTNLISPFHSFVFVGCCACFCSLVCGDVWNALSFSSYKCVSWRTPLAGSEWGEGGERGAISVTR